MPTPRDLQALYERTAGSFYHDQTVSRNPLRRWFHVNRYRIANSLVKGVYRPGHKVVDFGCGSCDWNTDRLDVFGIDLNGSLLERAKAEKRLLDYRILEAHRSGLLDQSFDIATAFEFLEHVPHYEEVIREARRVLRDGGYFIASVPYDVVMSCWRPLFFLQVILQGYILGDPYYKKRCGHVNHFSRRTIEEAFSRSGFEVDLIFDMRRFTIFLRGRKRALENAAPSRYADVTIILPTLNEGRNIAGVLRFLIEHYPGCRLIVADDGSNDGTREIALGLGYERLTFLDRRNETVHGLTASILDGAKCVETENFVVVDADGQHPLEKIEEVVNLLRLGSPLVIASRVQVLGKWPVFRRLASYLGTALGKISLICRGRPHLSYDILGGFFGCKTSIWKQWSTGNNRGRFQLRGYKVLFDFLKCAPLDLPVEEVFYRFEARRAGLSKANWRVGLEYLKSCIRP